MAVTDNIGAVPGSIFAASDRVRRRRRSEFWLKAGGIIAIGIASLMLLILVGSLVRSGYTAFVQTHVALTVQVPADLDPANPAARNWRNVVRDSLQDLFPDAEAGDLRALGGILSSSSQVIVRDRVVADPGLIGT